MGLRARLVLLFVAITVVPLTVAIFVLQLQLGQLLRGLDRSELAAATDGALLAVDAARARAGDLASDLGRGPAGPVVDAGDAVRARRLLDRLPDPSGRADVVVLVDADGRVLAARINEPAPGSGLAIPDDEDLAAAISGAAAVPGLLLEVREVRSPRGRRLGWVAAGMWADADLLARLPLTDGGGGAALVSGGRVLAAEGAPAAAVPIGARPGADTLAIGGQRLAGAVVTLVGGPDATTLLLWREPGAQPSPAALLGLLLPAMLVAAIAGWVLAAGVVAPVRRAADVARAVAGGDLRRRLEPRGGRELRDLAVALNAMSADLDARLSELRESRDELRQSLTRLGRTLSSSLDLDRTLAVVVETAMTALDADRGMLWLFTPERDALYVKVGRGIGEEAPRLGLGEGLAGHVALVGTALRLPADADQAPETAGGEPGAPHQLAVPMVGRGQVLGVLTLQRVDQGRAFGQDDLDTVRSFAAQASVAIENVMLHQEARRLSVTDPMTGLWNFRYFQMQADRELQSAARFARPLSLVVIDLDHFKSVNDRFGHQAGDAVLVEVARRIQGATRVPDVVARYGGEEFVVLLPGTDRDGARVTAERIRAGIAERPVPLAVGPDAEALAVTASIGVATHPVDARTVATLVRRADAAMYTAKQRGRNAVVGADELDAAPVEHEATEEPAGGPRH